MIISPITEMYCVILGIDIYYYHLTHWEEKISVKGLQKSWEEVKRRFNLSNT